jgi:tyrosyl-tRNA synthetase
LLANRQPKTENRQPNKVMNITEQLELIKRGTVEIIDEKHLISKLELSAKEKRPLVIKAGFDPTAPDIHLGHTVLLRKMRHFQDLGHKVVFLIGDFTATIGDPSGRSEIRKHMTEEEVKENAKTYSMQVAKVLDIDKCHVVFNSKWLKPMSLADFMQIAAHQTVARILERDDFFKRYKSGKEISFLEFIYPVLQAYDSVALNADIELGGTDQKFNLLMGRALQKKYGQSEQVVITMPLLEGTDGVQKMSKSYGNYIGVTEHPNDIFGKIMSISDDMMWRYYELLTDVPLDFIEEHKALAESNHENPKDIKMLLARDIITAYYNKTAAEEAKNEFENIFKRGNLPENIPVYKMQKKDLKDGNIWICALLTKAGLTKSNTESRKMIQQGAVTVAGKKISDDGLQIKPEDGLVIQVGKRRFIRLKSQ